MSSIPIKEFNKIPQFVQEVFNREIDLLVIESKGGLGKTHTVINSQTKEVQKKDMLVFSGKVTPLEAYMQIYQNPNKILIFDDVDDMLQNKAMVAILKQVCLIGKNKTISYSTSVSYDGKKVPRTFISNNKVIILCNNISSSSRDMKALLSRGFYIDFNPNAEEIHKQLCTFAKDKEILAYLEKHLNNIQEYNFRIYEKAQILKRTGFDWKHLINVQYNISNVELILTELKEYVPEQAEIEFMRRTGQPRTEYYKLLIEELKSLNKTKASKEWGKRTTATQRTFRRYWNQ